MKCLVDTRENSKNPDITEALGKAGVKTLVDFLDYGDYWLPPYLVERKTVGNFLQAVKTRQLWKQVEGMSRIENCKPVLLLEGSLLWIQKYRKFNISAVYGVLKSIQFDWKIPVFYCPNKYWTVNCLLQLAREEKLQKIHPVRAVPKNLSQQEIRRGVLEGVPGVGSSMAVKLLNHFGSIRKIANTDVEELQQVEGIGPNISRKIYEIFS